MVISHILGPFCYSAVPGTNTLVQHAHAFCMLSSTALLLSFNILTTGFTTVFKYTGAACTRVLHVVPLRASLGSDNCVYAHSQSYSLNCHSCMHSYITPACNRMSGCVCIHVTPIISSVCTNVVTGLLLARMLLLGFSVLVHSLSQCCCFSLSPYLWRK